MSVNITTDARILADAVSTLFASAQIVHDEDATRVTFRYGADGVQARMNVAAMQAMPQEEAAEALYAAAEKYVVDRLPHFR